MKRLLLVVLTLGFLLGVVSDTLAEDKSDFKKGLSYYHKGKFKEAVKYLGDYVDQSPEPVGYYLLGYSLYKLRRFGEAEEYFSQAYLIDPNFSPEHHGLPKRPPRKKAAKAAAPVVESAETKEAPTPKAASGKTEQKTAERFTPPQAAQKSEPQKTAKTGSAQVQGVTKTPAATPVVTPAVPAQGVAKTPATTPAAPAATPQSATPAPAAPSPAPQQASPPPAQQPKPTLPLVPPLGKQPAMPMPGMGIGLIGGILAGLGIFFLLFVIVIYLFVSYCLYRIAVRLNVPAAWTAWVPLLHLWAVVGSAGKPWWWILLLFVPLVNIFIGIYIWLCITENLGHNKWLGLLMLLPMINLLFMAYLAFTKSPAAAPSAGSAPEEDLT